MVVIFQPCLMTKSYTAIPMDGETALKHQPLPSLSPFSTRLGAVARSTEAPVLATVPPGFVPLHPGPGDPSGRPDL